MSKTIKIKKADLQADKYGNIAKITMVGIHDQDGKWIKWIKINQNLLDFLMNTAIQVDDKTAEKLINPPTNE